MGNDSILQVVIKVKDEMTPVITKIGRGFTSFINDAVGLAKKFFTSFSMQAFKGVVDGIKKVGEAFQWAGQKFNEFAPDAKKYQATFSVKEAMALREGAEAFNRLGAAWDKFVGQLLSKGGLLVSFFDDLTRRFKQVTDGPQLTEVGAAQAELQKLRDQYRTFQGKPMTEAQLNSPYYQGMLRAEDEAIRKAEERVKLAEQRYAVEKQILDVQKEQLAAAAQAARDPQVKDALKGLREYYRLSQEIEDTILLEDLANAWAAVGRQEEWANQQLERRKALDREVGEGLRGLKSVFKEIADFEREYWTDSWDSMWDEIDAREAKAAEDQARRLQERSDLLKEALERDRQRNEEAFQAYKKRVDELDASITASAQMMSDAFITNFEAVIDGTKSVAKAFTDMVGSILYDTGRMMASEALTGLFKSLIGSALGSAGGTPERTVNQAGDIPSYIPSGSAGRRTGAVVINVNGARDPGAVAREVRTAVMNLASSDAGVRRRLQIT